MPDQAGQLPLSDESHQLIPSPSVGLPEDPKLDGFWKEMETQTDRGVAVLAAAYLEWRVRQSIECCLPVWDKEARCIFGTDTQPGELSFKYQAKMAYCLKLIGPISLADVDRIGRIRNKFAHRTSVQSFDHEAVRDLCDELRTPEHVDGFIEAGGMPSPRPNRGRKGRYEFTVHQLSMMLWAGARSSVIQSAQIEKPYLYF